MNETPTLNKPSPHSNGGSATHAGQVGLHSRNAVADLERLINALKTHGTKIPSVFEEMHTHKTELSARDYRNSRVSVDAISKLRRLSGGHIAKMIKSTEDSFDAALDKGH